MHTIQERSKVHSLMRFSFLGTFRLDCVEAATEEEEEDDDEEEEEEAPGATGLVKLSM